jgi:DNA-binding MarR family transcriptional regulator
VSASTDVERLRHAVTRLARLLRQQDEGGLGATATGALASVCVRGPMTFGELAASEQVAPPTMTRIVEKLSALGYVSRQVDPTDRRVSHVTVTPAGRRYVESTRQRRRSWLAARMERLDHDQRARLVDALDVLELLGAVDGEPAALGTERHAR